MESGIKLAAVFVWDALCGCGVVVGLGLAAAAAAVAAVEVAGGPVTVVVGVVTSCGVLTPGICGGALMLFPAGGAAFCGAATVFL